MSAEDGHPDFSLAASVDEFYSGFPHLVNSVFFIDGRTNRLHHPDSDIEQLATKLIDASEALRQNLAEARELKMCAAFLMKELKIRFVVIHTDNPLNSLFGKKMPMDQRLHYLFNHEAGHAIFDTGSECIADTYAALRHMQRYGDRAPIERIAFSRAFNAAVYNGDYDTVKYYTSPVLNAVLEEAGKTDLRALSQEETARLTGKIVREAPQKPTAELMKIFERTFAFYNTDAPAAERMRNLADTVFETKDLLVQICGKIILQAHMDGRLSFQPGDEEKKLLISPEWEEIRTRLRSLKPLAPG